MLPLLWLQQGIAHTNFTPEKQQKIQDHSYK